MWANFTNQDLVVLQNSLSLSIMRGQDNPDSLASSYIETYRKMFAEIQHELDSRGYGKVIK